MPKTKREPSLPHPYGGRINRPSVEQFHATGVLGEGLSSGEIALDFFVDLPTGGGEVVVRLLFEPTKFNGIVNALVGMSPTLL
jgi:hypothetical protein